MDTFYLHPQVKDTTKSALFCCEVQITTHNVNVQYGFTYLQCIKLKEKEAAMAIDSVGVTSKAYGSFIC